MNQKELIEARKYLLDRMRKELLGPGSEFSFPDERVEVITDLPEVRYSVGVLYPQKNQYSVDNDDIAVAGAIEETHEDFELTEEQEASTGSTAEEASTDLSMGNNPNETEEMTLDESISLSSQILPSSMGYTFFVREDVSFLVFDLEFGTYSATQISDCKLIFDPDILHIKAFKLPPSLTAFIEFDNEKKLLTLKKPLTRKDAYALLLQEGIKKDDQIFDSVLRLCNQFGKNGFVRKHHSLEVRIEFKRDYSQKQLEVDGLNIAVFARHNVIAKNLVSITVMLINNEKGDYKGTNSIFQPVLKVDNGKNNITFAEYSGRRSLESIDQEEQSLDLLYRKKRVYATGHGTSVDWAIDDSGHGQLWNEFLPVSSVPQINFESHDDSVSPDAYSMKYLSDLDESSKEDKLSALQSVVASYSKWIDSIELKIDTLDKKHTGTARRHVKNCRECASRMAKGLKILESNSEAFEAFSLSNRAMFMQRIHSEIQSTDHYPGDERLQKEIQGLNYKKADYFYQEGQEPKWRPFQLAFMLMSLNAIVNPECEERDLVDLIWFPTGGGKTEAYLGLTAFTIFYRRLVFPDTASGTAVVMRYTLRLLASQQFVRASILICACEAIRIEFSQQKNAKLALGEEPITIGLWIGGSHTPNRVASGYNNAQYFVDKLINSRAQSLRYEKDQSNKFQILKCPWCGTKLVKDVDQSGKKLIGQWGYKISKPATFYMCCTQEGCVFEKKLPIQVVDEELYRNPPTLLFGTVDKFAMLPWKKDVGSFFASDNENRTPELIIQDELHLISGPLGTIVGLYETAIDALCSAKGTRPKLIASTATIRNAKNQCSALYNREVKQFPPPGIDADDSYFAKESRDKPGRLYMGIMPAGKTKAMMEIRCISTILQQVHMMPFPNDIKDMYWTLAIYFNSLRDLGKCGTLVDDDVKDFMRRMAARFGQRNNVRPIGSASELTSRVSTTQLNETLDRLESLVYSEENQRQKKYAIGVLLATNMISVGVDVDRLNVMLLVGQPKLTSEYIQASSRIGRSYPGVAFTLYDGAKSRDRSHYEQFIAYHDSFYKYVEPTGVTPFSKPSRDRAMHAVAVSLVRHLYGLAGDADAIHFEREEAYVEEILNLLHKRTKEINDRLDSPMADMKDDISEELNAFWNNWYIKASVADDKMFFYGEKFLVQKPSQGRTRLLKPFGSGGEDDARDTLTSMRNVDQSVAANILVWEEDQ